VSLQPGLTAKLELKVGEQDTAIALHSGDVPVLATPRVIALCEEVSVLAINGRLGPGETSVGMRVQLDHLHPTAIGTIVTAHAALEKVEGRRLTFTVKVKDAFGLLAAGKVTRVVVDRAGFLEKQR
jgi:predicted thioesterase